MRITPGERAQKPLKSFRQHAQFDASED
jgi:hypothetical protein